MTVNEQVLEYIKRYDMIPRGSRVTAGLSGGADSVCLLFLLSGYRESLDFSLEAIHVEHGIRGEEALEDMEFCERLCDRLGIALKVVHVDVPEMAREKGLTLEEAGRIARYDIFDHAAADRIAVAHHGLDQAETVLFNLFRGSAVAGLGGMRPVRDKVIRPLLCLTREQIEAYLRERDIAYCTDSTNFDNDISRNRIRNEIIPLAEGINPGAVRHINESAEYIREVEAYIQREAGKRVSRYVTVTGGRVLLRLEGLEKEENIIKDYVIRECISLSAGKLKDITSRHVTAVRDLTGNISGKKISLPYNITVIRNFDRLEFLRDSAGSEMVAGGEADPDKAGIAVPEEGSLTLPDGSEYFFSFDNEVSPEKIREDHRYTKWFDYDKIVGKPCLRRRRSGDRISIKKGSKKIKELFIEERIPSGERGNIYMLCDESEVIWIPGLRIGEKYKVSEKTKMIWKVERKDNG